VADDSQQVMLEKTKELIEGGRERGLKLRALGGIGVAFQCESALRPPLARDWKDVDMVSLSRQNREVQTYLEGRGLTCDREFNALHGHQRLIYFDPDLGYQLDVFVDRLVMCHTLELADRLDQHELTLDPADLLLTKLQVVETNDRDYRDILALLVDHDVDTDYIAKLLSKDWGWWRTATRVLGAVTGYAESLEDFHQRDRALAAIERLESAIEAAPKSRGWKLRSRIGERVRWYEIPEEADAEV
jgi:hypothetical protein